MLGFGEAGLREGEWLLLLDWEVSALGVEDVEDLGVLMEVLATEEA